MFQLSCIDSLSFKLCSISCKIGSNQLRVPILCNQILEREREKKKKSQLKLPNRSQVIITRNLLGRLAMMLEEKRKFSASERNSVDITDLSVRCFPAAKRATVNDNGLDRSCAS